MPQQRFAFLPLPQGHGSFRPLRAIRTSSVERGRCCRAHRTEPAAGSRRRPREGRRLLR
jgi:hypothetical protein